MPATNTYIAFQHQQSSHCESGVAANLLHHHGHAISEAMAFGIGEGLFFGYLPFIRVNKLPLTTFRCAVGGIINRLTRRLGIRVQSQKFRDPKKAMDALDAKLAEGIPVGCRTGGYWLPYFPEAFRFHFNMHNLVVYGKAGNEYLISDPVFPDPVRCPGNRLLKARFAKGALAPRGFMYYIAEPCEPIDLKEPIRRGIRGVCRTMIKSHFPLLGIAGMRYLAGRIEKWPERLGPQKAVLHVGQLIRMQEEIGTGGAGFRFMYAAFLQESAAILKNDRLTALSEQMTSVGDRWRRFALLGARLCKGRASSEETYGAMADILRDCAAREKDIYQQLMKTVDNGQSAGK